MSKGDALAKALLSAIGDNADNQAVSQFIDTGYAPLNRIISGRYDGGLPFGRCVEMFGASSSGKTALATDWMVTAQKMGGVAIFIDWERSFNVNLAVSFGLKTERPFWIYKKPKTWEEGNTIAAKACQIIRNSEMIPASAPILVVFDSIAAALPKSMTDKDIDEYTMNDTTALARVTSTTLKSMSSWAEEYNSTFLYLNQIRLKPGVVYGNPQTTPGGMAMEFYSTVRLSLGRTKIVAGSDKEFVGQKININCVKSKLTKPFQECSMNLMFDDAGTAVFDKVLSLIDHLVEEKALTMSGARVAWIDGKTFHKSELAKKLVKEGAVAELVKLLPPTGAAEKEAAA